MQYRIDLHTHSIISRDGGITGKQYKKILHSGMLNCVAITDHNTIEFAQLMHKKLGEQIIVGEEITTTDGEIIGLFLQKAIPAGLTAVQTVSAIHDQGGIVYIPHPLETRRKGLQRKVLEQIIDSIDIVETFNARARWLGKASETDAFSTKHTLIKAASSDAHGYFGVGSAYSTIKQVPTRHSIQQLLKEATLQKTYAPVWTYAYPAMNKVKNKFLHLL